MKTRTSISSATPARPSRPAIRAKRILTSILLTFAASLTPARAATQTWTGNTDSTWGNLGNWNTAVPTGTDVALFSTGGGASPISVTGTQTFGQLQINGVAATPAYQIGTSVDAGTLNLTKAGTGLSFNSGTQLINYQTGTGTAAIMIYSAVAFSTTASSFFRMTNTNAANLILAGDLNGGSATTNLEFAPVNAGATITLSGSNNFHGSTLTLGHGTSAGGNLMIKAAASLGAGVAGASIPQLQLYNTSGALQFDLGSGNTFADGSAVAIMNGHLTAETANIEVVSGAVNITPAVTIAKNDSALNLSYTFQSDAGGLLTLGGITSADTVTGKTQNVYLVGAGNGTTGAINGNTTAATSTLNLTKDGAGTWALSGNTNNDGKGLNASGATTMVASGTLLVNGDRSTGTSAVTVTGASSILGGTGTIGGSVTLTSGGTLAVGGSVNVATGVATAPIGSIGTLVVNGSFTGGSGTTFAFDLNSDSVTGHQGQSDWLMANGSSLDLSSATLSVQDLGTTTLSSGDFFELISYTGILSGNFAGLAQNSQITVGKNIYSIDYNSGSAIDLVFVNAVPEPTAWVLMLGGLAGLLGYRHRRSVIRL